ncbi:hypothetical protein LCGC14_1702210 [marine sediment metagenome]|uniref:Uncharacterized protein n=1 Tax=marine sediment metagenome TaxID=412755 RepID=A0A0F9JY34_9ZZZZ
MNYSKGAHVIPVNQTSIDRREFVGAHEYPCLNTSFPFGRSCIGEDTTLLKNETLQKWDSGGYYLPDFGKPLFAWDRENEKFVRVEAFYGICGLNVSPKS